MNTVLLICFGALYAIFLVGAVADTAARKAPWSEFTLTAAFGAAMVGGLAWLATAGLSWLSQNPWGWLLFFGLFIAGLFVYAVVGALCLVVDLLGGRYRD